MAEFTDRINLLKTTIRKADSSKIKFITAEKWRAVMQYALERMATKGKFDKDMLDDMAKIVKSIPQDKFVEAIVALEPYKPIFHTTPIKAHKSRSSFLSTHDSSTYNPRKTRLLKDDNVKLNKSIIAFKMSVCNKLEEEEELSSSCVSKKTEMEEIFQVITQQETLSKEFESKHHPYRKIIETFLLILENKFKHILSQKIPPTIDRIQQLLILDLKLLEDFILRSSQPYLNLFKSDSQQQKKSWKAKLTGFIRAWVNKHDKINSSVRKIMRSAARGCPKIKKLMEKLPNFAQVTDCSIPSAFQIQGCYIQSMSSLMQFSQTHTSKQSLDKLIEFRQSLGKDVDEFYSSHPSPSNNALQISSQIQLQIVKFVLIKLKGWLAEIYAQLKYLQIVYGEDDMAFRYDDASYMYAQVVTAVDVLQQELND